MSVFVDTSAIVALLLADDQNNEIAAEVWRKLIDSDEQIITSNYVVVETHALLQRRYGPDAIGRLVDLVIPALNVAWIDADLHTDAVAASMLHGRRGPSLVDCSSFALIRKLRIRSVFTFDSHFREQGFTVVP